MFIYNESTQTYMTHNNNNYYYYYYYYYYC